MARSKTAAPDIDKLVGEKIRNRRVLLGLTQDQVADSLGLSYQQIQKYETGANRVSAGRLYQIAQTLDTTVAWFFEDLDGAEKDVLSDDATSSRNVIELVRGFSRIRDDKVRATIMSLVRTLGGEADGFGEAAGDAEFARLNEVRAMRSKGSNGFNGHG